MLKHVLLFKNAQRRPELHRISWLEHVNKNVPTKFLRKVVVCVQSILLLTCFIRRATIAVEKCYNKPFAVPKIFNQWLSQVSLSALKLDCVPVLSTGKWTVTQATLKSFCFAIHTYLPVLNIVYICK